MQGVSSSNPSGAPLQLHCLSTQAQAGHIDVTQYCVFWTVQHQEQGDCDGLLSMQMIISVP